MDNKKPESKHQSSFHGNQYVDSKGHQKNSQNADSAMKAGGNNKEPQKMGGHGKSKLDW